MLAIESAHIKYRTGTTEKHLEKSTPGSITKKLRFRDRFIGEKINSGVHFFCLHTFRNGSLILNGWEQK